MGQDNNDLSKLIDQNLVDRTNEMKKMEEFYKTHPHRTDTGKPLGTLPSLSTDPNEAEIARLCKQMEEKSSKKHNGEKNKKEANAKKIATILAAGMGIAFITAPIAGIAEKAIESSIRDQQLEQAITYMDRNILPKVFQESGFVITGKDEKGNIIYDFDRYAYIRAQDKLMDYGFDRPSAELIIGEALGWDSRLYPTGDPLQYFEKLGYKPQGLLHDSINVFKNNNEVKVIYHVNELKDEYTITSGPTYTVDSSQIKGEESGNARG